MIFVSRLQRHLKQEKATRRAPMPRTSRQNSGEVTSRRPMRRHRSGRQRTPQRRRQAMERGWNRIRGRKKPTHRRRWRRRRRCPTASSKRVASSSCSVLRWTIRLYFSFSSFRISGKNCWSHVSRPLRIAPDCSDIFWVLEWMTSCLDVATVVGEDCALFLALLSAWCPNKAALMLSPLRSSCWRLCTNGPAAVALAFSM